MQQTSNDIRNEQPLLKKQTSKAIPIAQSQPNLFRWKTIALILTAFIALMLIVDILMYLYLIEHKQPPTNLTFITNILQQSTIIINEQQITNLIMSLSQADQKIKYQYASLLASGNSNQFTYNNVVQNVLANGYANLFYILQLQQVQGIFSPNTTVIGVYAASEFQVPKMNAEDEDKSVNQTLQYFTFQYGDDRRSTLISIGESIDLQYYQLQAELQYQSYPQSQESIPTFLKANSTSNKDLDLLDCKSYRMLKQYGYITLLQVLNITFSTELPTTKDDNLMKLIQAKVSVNLGNQDHKTWQCFYRMQSKAQLAQRINLLLGGKINFASEDQIIVKRFEIFHLYNAS